MPPFNISFLKLINDILPEHKRFPVRIKFIFQLTAWMRKIHSEFLQLVDSLTEKSKVTSNVIIIEGYLTKTFGDGITITVNEVQPNQFILDGNSYLVDANDQLDGYFLMDEEDSIIIPNYTVTVPAVLNADLDRISAILTFYQVPGSQFQIQET